MNQADIIRLKEKAGKLPSHIWPGGYPLVYVFKDGADCCPACANGENDSEATTEDSDCPDDWQWILTGAYIHWEGSPVVCEHCNAEIAAAYGDPDAGKETPDEP